MNLTTNFHIIHNMDKDWKRKWFKEQWQACYQNPANFDLENYAMELFDYQYSNNDLYRQYCMWIGVKPGIVTNFRDIPLLPISAFKFHEVKTGLWLTETIFRSSGTTGLQRSAHHVRDVGFYTNHARFLWEYTFGPLNDFCFVAILPGYVERGESSLVRMVSFFIHQTKENGSELMTGSQDDIIKKLNTLSGKKKTVLFGVSYALLSLMENFPEITLDGMIVETGGMKGLRENMTKQDLTETLKSGFKTENIYSEYGMTELFSQAYARGINFHTNLGLQVLTKQLQDPLSLEKEGKQGILGCIDLANIDTCAFILTEDSGIINHDGSFSLTGRLDLADARGCNLLLTEATS